MAYNREFVTYRVDANQKAIVKAFRQLGYSVALTHQSGEGMTDIVISKSWLNVLVEIKDGDKDSCSRRFTDKQEKFWFSWQGLKAVAARVEDVMLIDHYVKDILKLVDAAGIKPFLEGNKDSIYQPKMY